MCEYEYEYEYECECEHDVRTIMAITRYQQWKDGQNSIEEAGTCLWDGKMMIHFLMKHHLRWFGHLAGIASNHLLKHILYRELDKNRPQHGTRKGGMM